jgi:DNA polymerase-1
MDTIKKTLKFLGIKVFEKRGTEADDIIASLATQYLKEHKKGKIFIASSDSDFYQLLSKNIYLIHFGKKGLNTIFTPDSLHEKYTITPKQYILFKCLTGDTADNIKGISGIGPIRASKIINKEIDFNAKEHQSLLDHNKRLIALNTGLNVCKQLNVLALNQKIITMKNGDIFLRLRF